MSAADLAPMSRAASDRGKSDRKSRKPLDRRPVKIVVASHSHPQITKGGAEIAAHQLFRNLAARKDYDAYFLGCDRGGAGTGRLGSVFTQPFSDRDYVYSTGEFDWFKFANRDPRFPAQFEQLLRQLAPEVMHFHHYINFGVEVFRHVKRVLPQCGIVLTLHEYLGICHNFGQMITRPHRNLCHSASEARCNVCFPEVGKSDFFLRKKYIMQFLELVDEFISPSHFLADRYIAWGLPPEKMHVIENLVPEVPPSEATHATLRHRPLRIGFFGQISALKGIGVLLDAAQQLEQAHPGEVLFEIFGEYRNQPPEFQKEFVERLDSLSSNVRFQGPYDEHRVDRLMQSVHAVVVPSIWWENSPLVIQEAFRNRRPVICSDIGGMAEKVRDGIDGFHFAVGSSGDLIMLIEEFLANHETLTELEPGIKKPPEEETIIEAHMQLYGAVRAAVNA
jgi:glycosyltransferase involved in cell wall biosynthesis